MLNLGERAVRALVLPVLGNHISTMNGVQHRFLAATALARLQPLLALAHDADATVTA